MKEWSTATKDEMANITNCFNEMDKLVHNIQANLEFFQEDAIRNSQEHVDHAKKVDEEIYDLENQKNINIEGVKQLKLQVEKAFKDQNEIIDEQVENVKAYRNVTSDVILKSNEHHDVLTDIKTEVEELRLWKEEIISLQEFSEPQEDEEPTEIKTEEPEDTEFEVDNEDIKIEIEDEVTETEVEQPNQNTKIKRRKQKYHHSSSTE